MNVKKRVLACLLSAAICTTGLSGPAMQCFADDPENADMTTLLSFNSIPTVQSNTSGGTVTADNTSVDGSNVKIDFANQGDLNFQINPAAGSASAQGLVMWVKADSITFNLEVDTVDSKNSNANHYIVAPKVDPSNKFTYYTLDKSGTLATCSLSGWGGITLTNFEGFLLIPKEAMGYNWGAGGTNIDMSYIYGIGFFVNAAASMRVDDIGYYTDLNAFEASHVGVDFTKFAPLSAAVTAAADAYGKGASFYSGGWDAFKKAYDDAVSLQTNHSATAQQIADAVSALQTAQAALVQFVDRTNLQAAITAAQADIDKGAISFTSGWDAFSTAFDNAKAVNADTSKSQADVDAATGALTATQTALVAKYDKQITLEKLMADGGGAKKDFTLGSDAYQSGWDSFLTAYNAAADLLKSASITNAQVDTALSNLQTAMSSLRLKQYNQPTSENKGMTVVNDGSNLAELSWNSGRITLTNTTDCPDKVGYSINVKTKDQSTSTVDMSLDIMYPYDFDSTKADGFVFWYKAPAGVASPWMHFDVNEDTDHFMLKEMDYYTIVNGKVVDHQGPAVMLPGYEGWVIIPKDSIKFNWGVSSQFTQIDMSKVTSIGFDTDPDEEGGLAGHSFLLDDISVYTDLTALETALGVSTASSGGKTGGGSSQTVNVNQHLSGSASADWVVSSASGSFDSGYGCVTGLTSGDTVTIKDVDFQSNSAGTVSANLMVSTAGKINVYAKNSSGKTLIAVLSLPEANVLTQTYHASLTKRLTGKYDIIFELADGAAADFYSYAFSGTYGASDENPNTGDQAVPALSLLVLSSLAAGFVFARRGKK